MRVGATRIRVADGFTPQDMLNELGGAETVVALDAESFGEEEARRRFGLLGMIPHAANLINEKTGLPFIDTENTENFDPNWMADFAEQYGDAEGDITYQTPIKDGNGNAVYNSDGSEAMGTIVVQPTTFTFLPIELTSVEVDIPSESFDVPYGLQSVTGGVITVEGVKRVGFGGYYGFGVGETGGIEMAYSPITWIPVRDSDFVVHLDAALYVNMWAMVDYASRMKNRYRSVAIDSSGGGINEVVRNLLRLDPDSNLVRSGLPVFIPTDGNDQSVFCRDGCAIDFYQYVKDYDQAYRPEE